MHDILPADQPLWGKISQSLKETAEYYNFLRIDTPILESAQLFERPLGETSEVVEKQMFILKTRGGDALAMRPEGTAPIARAYIQHGMSHMGQPLKLYYEGPMFRHEQPQAGRLRQLHQAGFEIISNNDDPIYDAQVMLACFRFISGLKLKNLTIQMNSIGCRNCRPVYKKKLQDYYRNKVKSLCKDCIRRLTANPMRLLDCKEKQCQEFKAKAPIMLDSLCAFCQKHFKAVLEYMEELALPYSLNHYLARGFDYYTKTVFEIFTEGVDFALAGGGRYDYLIELLGGRHSPAVGGAIGLDRLIEVIKAQNINLKLRVRQKIALVHMGDLAKRKSLSLIEILRESGIDIMEFLGKDSLNTQLSAANKAGAQLALIFGQKEALEGSMIIRDMKTGVQEEATIQKLVKAIKRKMA